MGAHTGAQWQRMEPGSLYPDRQLRAPGINRCRNPKSHRAADIARLYGRRYRRRSVGHDQTHQDQIRGAGTGTAAHPG